ncbi:hypothetical protein M422DRAFT_245320 [Sphaerobolus stellatus SS14]|nr:hypothetical protein M422DRAFT_245320 [Sphaerobolus stellatus SS14]
MSLIYFRIMSVHSSPNPVATQDSRNHLFNPLGFTTTHFSNFSNVLSGTGTIDDDVFGLDFSTRSFLDNFQEPMSGLTIPNPSNTQPMSPMVQGLNDMSSSFPIKPNSQTAMNGQMMSASNMLDNFEPDSTPHAAHISLDAEPRVQTTEASGSSSGSSNLQPPESTNAHDHHEIIPPKRPEERDPEKYISIIPTKAGKPLFKCCWSGCPGVTFWERIEVTQHVHDHFAQKQHECLCGATFITKTSAQRHCREKRKKNICPGW